jgi:hypothetical protein
MLTDPGTLRWGARVLFVMLANRVRIMIAHARSLGSAVLGALGACVQAGRVGWTLAGEVVARCGGRDVGFRSYARALVIEFEHFSGGQKNANKNCDPPAPMK